MSYYASLADPGMGPVYTYTNVWDGDMMYGCNCDLGYFGPDCSLKDCPRGDDPFTGTAINPTTQQYNEKQEVVCVASGGTFTLTFRGETTARIPWDATAAQVRSGGGGGGGGGGSSKRSKRRRVLLQLLLKQQQLLLLLLLLLLLPLLLL